tara:strand:- start:1190 stop:2191 length:1002 start_codon:yes stop_codon:yes gene_type:complete
MAKLKIFVTGSEGFIGSHLVEKLVSKGHEVKALVLYNDHNKYGWLDNTNPKIKKNINFILGDIRDYDFINNQFKNIDVVIHLAALIGIPYSYVSPFSYLKTNVEGTTNIFKACLNNNVKKVINTSTSEVYGTAKKIPITESHQLAAQSPYAASKTAADQIGLSFYKSFNLPLATIRPFNTFGPRQSARAVISTIISQALRGKQIKLGNIHSTRDFTYIDDTIDAYMKCLNNKKIIGETFNLGTGYEISIEKIVHLVGEITNSKLNIKMDKLRLRPKNSEVDRLISSNLKCQKLINWKPKYSGLNGFKKGLTSTINWFDQNMDKINFKSNIYNL